MFTLVWTPEAKAAYDELKAKAEASLASRRKTGKAKSSKDEGLFRQVHKTLTLLAANPRHTGLQTHEYRSLPHPYDPKQKVLEAYAQNQTPGAYRIFLCYGPAKRQITLVAITPHP
jgi:hypothetical protein